MVMREVSHEGIFSKTSWTFGRGRNFGKCPKLVREAHSTQKYVKISMASASCRRPCQLLGMTVHPVLKLMIMGMCFVPRCLHLMPFGALLVSSGCLETRSTRDLGQGRRDLGPPRKFPVDLGAIWDGLGRPCVPQGVQKYIPRDEN